MPKSTNSLSLIRDQKGPSILRPQDTQEGGEAMAEFIVVDRIWTAREVRLVHGIIHSAVDRII